MEQYVLEISAGIDSPGKLYESNKTTKIFDTKKSAESFYTNMIVSYDYPYHRVLTLGQASNKNYIIHFNMKYGECTHGNNLAVCSTCKGKDKIDLSKLIKPAEPKESMLYIKAFDPKRNILTTTIFESEAKVYDGVASELITANIKAKPIALYPDHQTDLSCIYQYLGWYD